MFEVLPIDDIEGCISAKEEILRLESDLERIEWGF